ncbi:ester cyclase [Nocardia brasiliensis]|uniref:ester cyclase n=1 Tax=Nocardia brasiliensis TaxID=37326 RepID=UPI003D7BFC33
MIEYDAQDQRILTTICTVFAAVNRHDAKAVRECYSDDAHARDNALRTELTNPEIIESATKGWIAAVPDLHFEVIDIVHNRLKAAIECIFSGTLSSHIPGVTDEAALGSHFEIPYVSIMRFSQDGAIQQESYYWNLATLLDQIRIR